MRHLLSLLLGILIAPVVWVGAGYGQAKLATPPVTLNNAAIPLAILAGVGVVFALIAVTRVSPIGPFFAGLLLIAGQVAYVAQAERFKPLLEKRVLGVGGEALITPAASGLAAVLGACLLFALFSFGRWRKRPRYAEPEDPMLSESAGQIGAPTPAGARRSYGDDPLGPPMGGSPVGMPEEPTRSYAGAGAPAGSDRGRYEAFGYVSDEPTRSAAGWPDPPQPSWRPGDPSDPSETESTTRLHGSGGPADPGISRPWTEPPRLR